MHLGTDAARLSALAHIRWPQVKNRKALGQILNDRQRIPDPDRFGAALIPVIHPQAPLVAACFF